MKKSVLIVDNNKVLLHLVSRFMEQRQYEVATAEDGLAALNVLDSFRPGLIFIDLVMPKINGEQLCRIIRQLPEHAGVFLVIISAIAAEEKIDFLSLGADACVAKGPFKEMAEHLAVILEHFEQDDPEPLRHKIFGTEKIFEREIIKELLAAKKHFEVTLGNMTDGFLELTEEADIIFANATAARLFGMREDQLLSARFPDLFPVLHAGVIRGHLDKLDNTPLEIGAAEPIVLQGRQLLMKLVPFADQGQNFIIVLIHDITRLKETEQELRLHKERLEELVAERTAALEEKNDELADALSRVKTLSGLLPICASCKKIRDDQGYWSQIEVYIKNHSHAEFSHSICPDCAKKLYPELF
ncbi:response regulator [Thiovibrio sp. JS02]